MAEDRLTPLLRQIEELGEGTPEYYDCMAFLFITLARSQWRRADIARSVQRDRAKRQAAARKRKAAKAEHECTETDCTIDKPHGSHSFRAGTEEV